MEVIYFKTLKFKTSSGNILPEMRGRTLPFTEKRAATQGVLCSGFLANFLLYQLTLLRPNKRTILFPDILYHDIILDTPSCSGPQGIFTRETNQSITVRNQQTLHKIERREKSNGQNVGDSL
jgi:hypothetical protein